MSRRRVRYQRPRRVRPAPASVAGERRDGRQRRSAGEILMKLPGKIHSWLAERYNVGVVEDFVDHQTHKPLPRETGFWHTFGSLSLFLFLNQVVTGILL